MQVCALFWRQCFEYLTISPLLVSIPSHLSSLSGANEGIQESVCDEVALQVWDDQEIRLRLLLGGARHHGPCQVRMDSWTSLRFPRYPLPLHGHGVHARSVGGAYCYGRSLRTFWSGWCGLILTWALSTLTVSVYQQWISDKTAQHLAQLAVLLNI